MRKLMLLGAVLLALAAARTAGAQQHAMETAAFDSLGTDSVLSLIRLERLAESRNPDIEAARRSLDAARAMPKIESGLPYPEIELSIGPGAIGHPEFGTAYRVAAKQMIPLRRPAIRVAQSESEVKSAEWAQVRNEISRTVRQAYVGYVHAAAVYRVIREQQVIVEEARRAALHRYAAGLVGEADALMAETEVAELEHKLAAADNERLLARARINAVLNRKWTAAVPPAPPFLKPVDLPELQPLVEKAWISRPDLAAAAARTRADAAALTTVRAVPELGLMAGYDRFWLEKPLRPMVGVSVSVPLWGGGGSQVKKAAEAAAAAGRARETAAVTRIGFEVQNAYWSAHEARHELGIIQETLLPAAQRALRAARAGYESGKSDFPVLLSAERSLTEARLMELHALANFYNSRADLEYAIGGDLPWRYKEEDAR